MEAEHNSGALNCFKTSGGNIFWGAALTLAWKQLSQNIIKEPIKIKAKEKVAHRIVEDFNKSKVSKADLSPQCYYIKSGFGNKTVKQINEEVSKKFKDKSTAPIEENLPDDGIISYAYFFKDMKFNQPFVRQEIIFKNKFTDGFKAKNIQQKKQILVYRYKDRNNFTVQLLSKSQKDQIFLIKSDVERTYDQILKHLPQHKQKGQPLCNDDIFQMPCVSVHANHSVDQLVSKPLANKGFQEYFFSEIYEIIKLDIDQTGVKVQNQGVIKAKKCMVKKPKQFKQIIIDQPFWIVMREKQKNAYFMAFINCLIQK